MPIHAVALQCTTLYALISISLLPEPFGSVIYSDHHLLGNNAAIEMRQYNRRPVEPVTRAGTPKFRSQIYGCRTKRWPWHCGYCGPLPRCRSRKHKSGIRRESVRWSSRRPERTGAGVGITFELPPSWSIGKVDDRCQAPERRVVEQDCEGRRQRSFIPSVEWE